MSILSVFMPANANVTTIIFMALGGLGLFLFGLHLMSTSLKGLAGNKLKLLIEKTTGNVFTGILVGMLITILIQSSSATTVIVIGLIGVGLMTLPQAFSVMMGANIGTCITAFIIGLDISDYSLPIVFIGVVLILFFTRKKINLSGEAIFGFGVLFLGLDFMSSGLGMIAEKEFFIRAVEALSNYWPLSLLTGIVGTGVIQSSSAFIGIIQRMYEGGSIGLEAVIPMLYGANIGTTVTAFIASLGANKAAKQAAIANMMFNVLGTIIFLCILSPFTSLCLLLENSLGKSMILIAIAHLFFNIVTTLILVWFTKYIIKLVTLIIKPDKETPQISAALLNDELLHTSPVLALEGARKSILDMAYLSLEMVETSQKYLNDSNVEYFNTCMALEDQVDMYDHLLHDYLMQIKTELLNERESIEHVIYLDTIRDLERIGDHAVNLVEFFKDRYDQKIVADKLTLDNLNYFFNQIIVQTTNALKAFINQDKEIAKRIIKLEEEIDTLERRYRKDQWTSISTQKVILSDIHYVDILSNLERISDHCCNIAENVIDPYYMKRQEELKAEE